MTYHAMSEQKCPIYFQYNVFLRKNPRIDILSKVKDSLLPVMWIEEYGEERIFKELLQVQVHILYRDGLKNGP